jgi:hypothetical protein
LNIDEYLDNVEKKIPKRGHVISTWYSSKRRQNVGDVTADLLARGNMAVKGKLLSRMWAWTAPAWETLAVVFCNRGKGNASVDELKKLVANTEKYMSENNIKWSWLTFVSETGFDSETVDFARASLKKEVGIMLVDLPSKAFIYNKAPQNKYGSKVFKP